jgi:glycerophosphoryl diester phosphodiesterase
LLAVSACVTGSGHGPKGDLATRLRGPLAAAHRGGYRLPDANTVARFEVARQQGLDIVETDLRASKDGVVFLFHNSLLDRVTSCAGPIASYTAAELERCHLTGLDHGPDRFEDALRWSQGRVVIDAELKTDEVTEPAIDLVRRYSAYGWVYFQVGNGLRVYEHARRYDARVALEAGPRGPRGERLLAELLGRHDPNLLIIQLHPDFLSPEILRAIGEAGKLASINAWLLAPESDAATCDVVFAHGIDIAVTNAPESCAQQRDQARAAWQERRRFAGAD